MSALPFRILPGADGLRLRTFTWGPAEGPRVLLLHGFPESGQAWGPVAAALAARGFSVFAPDLRGYAGSDRPTGTAAYALPRLGADIEALVGAIGGVRLLAGHDWGGAIAWWLATHRPGLAPAFAVLNCAHPAVLRAAAFSDLGQLRRSWYILAFQAPGLAEALLAAGGFRALRRALVDSARPGTFPPAALAGLVGDWERPGALTAMLSYYRAAFQAPPDWGNAPITAPFTLLWGEADHVFLPRLADESLAHTAGGRRVPFPGLTHWLHHEDPSAVAAALAAAVAP